MDPGDLRKVVLHEVDVELSTMTVRIRELSAIDYVDLQADYLEMDGQSADDLGARTMFDLFVRTAAASIVDASGNRYLNDSAGIEFLQNSVTFEDVRLIAWAALDLNGMTQQKKTD